MTDPNSVVGASADDVLKFLMIMTGTITIVPLMIVGMVFLAEGHLRFDRTVFFSWIVMVLAMTGITLYAASVLQMTP